jgi:hypothetical protein
MAHTARFELDESFAGSRIRDHDRGDLDRRSLTSCDHAPHVMFHFQLSDDCAVGKPAGDTDGIG